MRVKLAVTAGSPVVVFCSWSTTSTTRARGAATSSSDCSNTMEEAFRSLKNVCNHERHHRTPRCAKGNQSRHRVPYNRPYHCIQQLRHDGVHGCVQVRQRPVKGRL